MTRSVEGYVTFRGHRTWYQSVGDLTAGTPLLLLHGGPGIPGGAFEPLMSQLGKRRPVIRYDQLGCGRSDRPNGRSLWNIQTFVDELDAVRRELGLAKIHLLGHSWGGMLALEYLLRRPNGVRSLILSSSLCSTPFWVAEARRLRSSMAAHVVASMQRYENRRTLLKDDAVSEPRPVRPGITPDAVAPQARMMQWSLKLVTTPLAQRLASWASHVPPLRRASYEIAAAAFMRRHLCRSPEFPLLLCQDFLARNEQVYETMWGPSEFFATGNLAEWDVEDRLREILLPTLIVSGRYDEATPPQQEKLRDGIAGSEWVLLEESAHMSFLEQPDRYHDVVAAFLDRVERDASPQLGVRGE